MKSQLLAASVALAALMTPAATAQQAVQWKVEDGGNGHWYQLRDFGTASWQAQRLAADALGGHLATITSPGENGVVRSLISLSQPGFGQNYSFGASIGLVQAAGAAEPSGGWGWITGEPLGLTDWAPGEPTNSAGIEHWARYQFRGGVLGWNDTQESFPANDVQFNPDIRKAVVEWSADCNLDGIVDYGQIKDGSLADADVNGIPDICECPLSIRVPQDQPSIDAAASFACPGLPLEIVVSEGTWPMSLALEGDYRITVRGVSRFNTIVTQDEDGVPINGDARAGASTTKLLLKNLTLANVRDSQNLRVGFEACDVRSCAATFLPGDMPVVDNLVEDCGPGGYPAFIQSPLVMNAVTFNRCARPVLLVTDGARALVDCHFNDCSGTAVRIRGGDAPDAVNAGRLDRCTFSRNVGGAVVVDTDGPAGTPVLVATFIDCSFTDNAYAASGGAVRLGTPGISPNAVRGRGDFVRCAFLRNSAPTGGAIYLAGSHPARLESCTFTGNVATGTDGGAVAQEFGGYLQGIEVIGGTFAGNRAAERGGAVRCAGWAGKVSLLNATFTGNEALLQGGALYVDRQVLSVADCAFDSNRAFEQLVEGGGAIAAVLTNATSADNVVFRSQFTNNSAPGIGGAISCYYRVATDFVDCTFTGNQAGRQGGAISMVLECTSAVRASRMSGNSAPVGSAVFSNNSAPGAATTIEVDGCIFSSNPGPSTVFAASLLPLELNASSFCGSGPAPFAGNVIEVTPSCVTQFCTDSDGNGLADGCECSQNPGLPSCCLGDIYSDKVVNGGDLGVLLSQWGQSGVAGDLDGDGSVTGGDLGALLANWGPCQ